MARAIKFTEDYGQVLKVTPSEKENGKPTKEWVGGFKKGEIMPNCSSHLAQKMVNHYKVAEFVEAKAGDSISSKTASVSAESKKILDDAKAEAKTIIEDAKAEAAKASEGEKLD